MKLNNEPKVTITLKSGWEWAKRMALRTVNKKPIEGREMPTTRQKLAWLFAEHSQIKEVEWIIDIDNLRQWVGVHLIRHPFLRPYISTQRASRQDKPEEIAEQVLSFIREDIVNDPDFDRSHWRDYRLQGGGNNHSFVVNAQTLINMSRKRLCRCASKETREVWKLVVDAITENDPEMGMALVPNCVYRGFCPEERTCGFSETKEFYQQILRYRGAIGRNLPTTAEIAAILDAESRMVEAHKANGTYDAMSDFTKQEYANVIKNYL